MCCLPRGSIFALRISVSRLSLTHTSRELMARCPSCRFASSRWIATALRRCSRFPRGRTSSRTITSPLIVAHRVLCTTRPATSAPPREFSTSSMAAFLPLLTRSSCPRSPSSVSSRRRSSRLRPSTPCPTLLIRRSPLRSSPLCCCAPSPTRRFRASCPRGHLRLASSSRDLALPTLTSSSPSLATATTPTSLKTTLLLTLSTGLVSRAA
mmetsp:Transcript_988/g.1880  ORF Transcript_988/g.1880 Transcript_988/m.1880 type:complete len:210 (-) Transcript_988:2872-3501(-)